jgi:hypothetical protein
MEQPACVTVNQKTLSCSFVTTVIGAQLLTCLLALPPLLYGWLLGVKFGLQTSKLSRILRVGANQVSLMCTGAVVSLAAWMVAKEVLKRFHFVGYNHSER